MAKHACLVSPPYYGHLFPMTTLGKQLVARGWRVSLCIDECFAAHIPGEIEHIKMTLPRREGLPDRADERATVVWNEMSLVDCGDDLDEYTVIFAKALLADFCYEDSSHLCMQAMDYMAGARPDVCIVDFGLLGGEGMYIKVFCNKHFMPVLRMNSFATPEVWPPTPRLIEKLAAAHLLEKIPVNSAKLDRIMAEHGYENGPNDDLPTTIFPTIPRLFYSPEGTLVEPSEKQVLCGPLVGTRKDVVRGLADEDADLDAWLGGAATPVVYVAFGTLANLSRELIGNLAAALVPDSVRADPASARWRVLWSLRADLHRKMPASAAGCAALRVEKFVPQPAVLRHDSVKLFVTHCGQNSSTEGLLAGKPMVGIPMMADQISWAHNIALCGAGKYVLKSAGAQEISEVVNEVFADPRYAEAARSIGGEMQRAAPRATDIVVRAMVAEIEREEARKSETMMRTVVAGMEREGRRTLAAEAERGEKMEANDKGPGEPRRRSLRSLLDLLAPCACICSRMPEREAAWLGGRSSAAAELALLHAATRRAKGGHERMPLKGRRVAAQHAP